MPSLFLILAAFVQRTLILNTGYSQLPTERHDTNIAFTFR